MSLITPNSERGRSSVHKYRLKESSEPNCTMLSVELIGHGAGQFRVAPLRAGVNIVLGFQRGALFREAPLKGYTDYGQSNSVGSRGIYRRYYIEGGRVYHVMAPRTWKQVDDYYCRVERCEIVRMDIDEVFRWLKSR